ncbi:MAG TPA: hypothetical protein VGX92_10785 [Pyrinomonadaceae bacterium]|jgi:hypothetical protein|nr:hypothetical protein [Pyrinomonadaceae bacterium]
MTTIRRSLAILFLQLVSVNLIFAQTENALPGPIVTASASTDSVRFVSLGEVYQMRVEAFALTEPKSIRL